MNIQDHFIAFMTTFCDVCGETRDVISIQRVFGHPPLEICADCLKAALATLEAATNPKEGLRG